jgi:hypothetical protein
MAAPTIVIQPYPTSRVAEYPPTSARKHIVAVLTVDGSVGASPGDIPATLFGLKYLEESSPLIKDDNTLIVDTSPTYDGTSLLGKAAGTAAPAAVPAGNYMVDVFGY